jgi:hypothetical protein
MAKSKKKAVKKMQAKKLEDRIAPGMVGGGLVDPGMVDVVDGDATQQQDQSLGEGDQTQLDSSDGVHAEGGEYIDEAGNGELPPEGEYAEGDDLDENKASEDYQADSDYQEFAQNDAPAADFVEEAPAWQEPDWVTASADGTFEVQPPEGVSIDNSIASFPVELANEVLPLPDEVTITAEGGMEIGLPEGTSHIEGSNMLVIPEGAVQLDEIPEGFEAFENPDGSVMVNLPDDGAEYNAETNTLELDNFQSNELLPENVELGQDGSVDVTLPDNGIEYNDDGSLQFSPEAVEAMDNPAPEYMTDMDCAEHNADGSTTITPPEGVEVDGGVAHVDFQALDELPLDENFQINDDGSSAFALPEGAEYSESVGGITFPEGEINIDEVPEGMDAHINPDGTATVMLTDGMDYDLESNSVQLDNFWTNEVTPDNMNVEADGSVNIALPEGTEYYDDGSFTIPADQIDFATADVPQFVDDYEFTQMNDDGGYTVEVPEGFDVNPEQGSIDITHDSFQEHCAPDDGLTINADGTMTAELPEGSTYDASAHAITFPEGDFNMDEKPEQMEAKLNDDGSVTLSLQDGMEYQDGNVNLDNYWTNELTPEAVDFNPDGSVHVELPQDCEFGADGSFTIPEYQADFLENPDPSYMVDGPDFIDANPDGSFTVENFENIEVNPEAGTVQMETEFFNENFDNQIPEEVNFNTDGTMDIQTPEGTQYDTTANSLTFPEGEVHMDQIPEQIQSSINPDGSITVQLQDGMEFQDGSVHMDNYWTNELTPDALDFSEDGQCTCDLPEDTHYFEDGSFNVPEGSADFIDQPLPEYIDQGPDWVNDNPDGSVTVQAPEGAVIDAAGGSITFDYDLAQAEFQGDLIPEDFDLHADGTADIGLPEGTQYDAETNSMTFPEGEAHMNEIPEGVDAHLNEDGTITVNLGEGMEYNAEGGTVHISNELLNEFAPGPINIGTDGSFQIELPDDTQYFEGDGFVISAESADFLDDGAEPHDHPHTEATGEPQAA